MVAANKSSTNANKDKTPMILAITIAAVLNFLENVETSKKILSAENSIGHKLKPNTLTPYRHTASVVIDNNNLRIEAI
jgi:hypothetical protein